MLQLQFQELHNEKRDTACSVIHLSQLEMTISGIDMEIQMTFAI